MLKLREIRHELHQHPELSGMEKETARILISYLEETQPDRIIPALCGHGVLALYHGHQEGPTILLRAELDALPIQEETDVEYISQNTGVSHACGHDGHMAILLGVGEQLQDRKSFKGTVALLFQPAEEISQGARCLIDHPAITDLKADYVFALHNLPSYERGRILLRKGVFASSSIGAIIRLIGKTSHAGHPEDGNSPVHAMTKVIEGLQQITDTLPRDDITSLLTITHAKLGEVAFGTAPGKAHIMATLRSTNDDRLQQMKETTEELIALIASDHHLKYELEWVEYFPATINDDDCVDLLRQVAKNQGKSIREIQEPFSWTEDFSFFLQRYPGAFFGIGAGKHHPQLHNSDYNFPGDLIDYGLEMFLGIIRELSR